MAYCAYCERHFREPDGEDYEHNCPGCGCNSYPYSPEYRTGLRVKRQRFLDAIERAGGFEFCHESYLKELNEFDERHAQAREIGMNDTPFVFPLALLREKLLGTERLLKHYSDLAAACAKWLDLGVYIERHGPLLEQRLAKVAELEEQRKQLREAIAILRDQRRKG